MDDFVNQSSLGKLNLFAFPVDLNAQETKDVVFFGFNGQIITIIMELVDKSFDHIMVRGQPHLVITVVQNHDLLFLVDKETGIRISSSETKFVHSFAEVLIEELGRIHLSIDALVEFQHNMTSFTAFRSIELGKFHVDRALLRTLADGRGSWS
jgi:hypothetical protein